MAYITGSVTDANPGPALHTLMATALTTAGFTLVDTVVISTRTHKIWKSPAASNVQNLDWYLDIGYTTTGAGSISLVTFEYYDPATDLGYRGPVINTGGTTIDAATGSRYGAAGFALETNWFGAHIAGTRITISTSFGYWMSITPDRIIALSSGSPDQPIYAGFYEPDPLYAAKASGLLYPLYTGQILEGKSASTPTAGLTRIAPMTVFLSTSTWSGHVEGGIPGPSVYPLLPTGPPTAYPHAAFRIPLTTADAATPAHRIARFGWLRDCYVVPSAGSVVRGDVCTISGDQHVLSTTGGTSASLSVAFKAA